MSTLKTRIQVDNHFTPIKAIKMLIGKGFTEYEGNQEKHDWIKDNIKYKAKKRWYIDVAFKFLKLIVSRKARVSSINRKCKKSLV